LLAPLGICVGALLRNQTLAVVGVLIVAVVIDPLLAQEAPEIARFEPLSGVPSAILSGIGGWPATRARRSGCGGARVGRRDVHRGRRAPAPPGSRLIGRPFR
jgi:hypothetical protein